MCRLVRGGSKCGFCASACASEIAGAVARGGERVLRFGCERPRRRRLRSSRAGWLKRSTGTIPPCQQMQIWELCEP